MLFLQLLVLGIFVYACIKGKIGWGGFVQLLLAAGQSLTILTIPLYFVNARAGTSGGRPVIVKGIEIGAFAM